MNAAIQNIQDFDDPKFDPFFEDELVFGDIADPYPRIAELRHQAAVIKADYRVLMGLHPDITMAHLPHYTVLGYQEVEQVFSNPQLYSNQAYAFNLGISFGRSVSTMDAPEHTKYRKIFQKAFLPQTVAKW